MNSIERGILFEQQQPKPPIDNCAYQDPADGTCCNKENMTPECHQWACPILRIIPKEGEVKH